MKRNYVPTTLDQYINESKSITLKRGYKDRKPVVVGANAPVRNQILSYVAEGQRVAAQDLKRFIAGLNETNANPNAAANMWLRRNGKFFITESKGGVTYFKLSKLGQRLTKSFSPPIQSVSEAKVNEKDKADFIDPKTGKPGLTDEEKDVEESSCSKTNEECTCGCKEGEKCTCKETNEELTEGVSPERRERIEKLIENIKAKQTEKLNEEDEEEVDVEASDEDGADELSFDDLDLSGEGGEKGGDDEGDDDEGDDEGGDDLDLEGGDDAEGDEEVDVDEKVEITEFIITVDDVDSAIEELGELGVNAEKVLNDDAVVNEAEEGEGDDVEAEVDVEDESDDESSDEDSDDDDDKYKDDEISVPADQWDALKGWLEEKGVDVEEMFGGEIEVEDVEDEGELDVDLEGEGEGELDVDLEGGEGELDVDIEGEGGEGELDIDLDLGGEGEPEVEEALTGFTGTRHENETANLIKGAKTVIIKYDK